MKRKRVKGVFVFVCGLAALMVCGSVWASANPAADADKTLPPMVTKHLLVPESDGSKAAAGPAATSRITFTGVLVSPQGKKVLLETGSASQDGASPASWYTLGDAVGPYTLQEIGPNAVVLQGSGETLRLPLYGTEKNRPQPVEVAAGPADKGQLFQKGAQQSQGQEQGQEQQQAPNPFGPAPGKGVRPPTQTPPPPQAQGGGTNPLQQAIEKARQGQGSGQPSPQGPFPPPAQGGGSNPFQELMKKKQ